MILRGVREQIRQMNKSLPDTNGYFQLYLKELSDLHIHADITDCIFMGHHPRNPLYDLIVEESMIYGKRELLHSGYSMEEIDTALREDNKNSAEVFYVVNTLPESFYVVSRQFADFLKKEEEIVVAMRGTYIWGRHTIGMATYMDNVFIAFGRSL